MGKGVATAGSRVAELAVNQPAGWISTVLSGCILAAVLSIVYILSTKKVAPQFLNFLFI